MMKAFLTVVCVVSPWVLVYAGIRVLSTEDRAARTARVVPVEPDPVVGEVWWYVDNPVDENPFEKVIPRQARVLEIRGEWVQYEFNSGIDNKPVVNSTKISVFKLMYRRSK